MRVRSSYLKQKAACRVVDVNGSSGRGHGFGVPFLSRMIGFPTSGCARMNGIGPLPLMRLLCVFLACLAAPPSHAETAAHIVLQDSPLAGFQYHAGKVLWPRMRVGDALVLVREPDNRHDAKAVRVEWQGHKIGYVPRRENADVARLLDAGQPLAARIVRLAEVRDPWARVRFEIVIPLDPQASE